MKKNGLIWLALTAMPISVVAQEFTERNIENVNPIIYGDVIWLDSDNDGRKEFVLTGAGEEYGENSQFFKNTSDVFEEVMDLIEPVQLSAMAKADFNNDEFEDFIITGYNGDINTTHLYLNSGDGDFEQIPLDINAVTNGKIDAADYNLDGRVDIIMTGVDTNSTYIAKMYLQNHAGEFVEQEMDLMANYFGDICSFDADNDGDLDLLLTGFDLTYAPKTTFYLNNSLGGMTAVEDAGFMNFYFSSSAAADIDSDGDLDLVINGINASFTAQTTVYTNDGEGVFTEVEDEAITDMYFGTIDLIDYNGDGHVDLFMTGYNADSDPVSVAYDNEEGAFVLNELLSDTVIDVAISGVEWSDYDNDSDLDLIITGMNIDGERAFRLYENRTFEPFYVGLEKNELVQIEIYPNPNNGTFKIDFESQITDDVEIEVYNTQGEMIYRSLEFQHATIDLSGIAKGIYFIHFNAEIDSAVQKIVVN
ncbi:T9SS type A sorting domain-containing protein [Crocinitomix catalasitica]|uniref:T9SS type A sorting domain-containing protein n=1 Tax=Crocinitomix catalasitica TaxID=184607 RepID=UPI0004805EB9|nr:T9SS type A sorting domain-containing protein [Crocinitomix catalasitica]